MQPNSRRILAPATVTTTLAVFIPLMGLSQTASAQSVPTPDDAKRAIESTLQEIWQRGGAKGKRTVLFQDVRPGRSTSQGKYPFHASLLVHDHDEGYPPNKYYGRTCVGIFEQEPFNLVQDASGNWRAQGRMTAPLSDCKDNPSATVSAIPLATLKGAPAPAATSAPKPLSAAALRTPPQGPYECWANGQARLLMNFTVLPNNQYRDSSGKIGSFSVAPDGKVTFKGGLLDGALPAGFYAIYHAPGGTPTVSFRSASGNEAQFCEH